MFLDYNKPGAELPHCRASVSLMDPGSLNLKGGVFRGSSCLPFSELFLVPDFSKERARSLSKPQEWAEGDVCSLVVARPIRVHFQFRPLASANPHVVASKQHTHRLPDRASQPDGLLEGQLSWPPGGPRNVCRPSTLGRSYRAGAFC